MLTPSSSDYVRSFFRRPRSSQARRTQVRSQRPGDLEIVMIHNIYSISCLAADRQLRHTYGSLRIHLNDECGQQKPLAY